MIFFVAKKIIIMLCFRIDFFVYVLYEDFSAYQTLGLKGVVAYVCLMLAIESGLIVSTCICLYCEGQRSTLMSSSIVLPLIFGDRVSR